MNFISPYRADKNLGKAYNDAIKPLDGWICITDYDVLFLLPETCRMIEEYTKKYPDTGIFTCFTNRIHPLAKMQLNGDVSEDFDVRNHIDIAKKFKENSLKVTEITTVISGFLMVIHKNTWKEIRFSEDGKCLGVDNDFSARVLKSGRKIYRMDSVYVFHIYRSSNIKDKQHLF